LRLGWFTKGNVFSQSDGSRSLAQDKSSERLIDIPDAMQPGDEMTADAATDKKSGFTERSLQNVLIGSLAVSALGLLLPWVTLGFFSASGLDAGDGKVYGVLTLAAALFVVLWRRSKRAALGIIAIIVCVLMTAVSIYQIIKINIDHGPDGLSASPGMGLILDAIAAIGATVSCFMLLRTKSARVEDSQSGSEMQTGESIGQE
jgi:hypothetical protein